MADGNEDLQKTRMEVRQIIADIVEVPAEQVGDDTSLADELGVDSLMALEIVATIEKKYRVKIPEERLQQVKTLNDTVALAREYITKA
jgi:acyl carrier protein